MEALELAEACVTYEPVSKRYEVGERLGQGAYGEAFLGTRKEDGMQVVLKTVRISDLTEKEKRAALSEAQLLSQFHHANIIRYYECIVEDGALNIVMEHADEGDLGAVIEERAKKKQLYGEDQIMFMFVQLLLALLHVHSKNILHRDIKSQNIFLCKGGILKLGDFGISRVLTSSASMAKTMVGTPFHLSPEMCNDEPYNAKSDVWALGCLLYELTTLKRAFDGNFLPAVVVKILQGKYPPIGNQFTRALRNLVDSMLQQSPQARPSVQEILRQTYVRQYVTRYARYMMEHSEEEATSIGVEQIPGVLLADAIQPAAPPTSRPPAGMGANDANASSVGDDKSSSRKQSAVKKPQRDRWSANRRKQLQAQEAEKEAVVQLPDSPEKRCVSGRVQRSSHSRASTDSFTQAALDISEQVGTSHADSRQVSGPTPFQPRVKPSAVHGGHMARGTSRASLTRSDSGEGAGSNSSNGGSANSNQVRLDVKVKQHELENRLKVEAQKEQKRKSALERDRKKREEAERRRLEKQEAMEAKARERERKMEEEKQRKARSEILDAQLKEKERERARERKEANQRIHDFKEGLKAVRPTLRRSTLKEKGAKFAEKQAAVRPGSSTIVHVPVLDATTCENERASSSQGGVSVPVNVTHGTSQPGTPPRAEGKGGGRNATRISNKGGVKFPEQCGPLAAMSSPQAAVACGNNKVRRLWSRGGQGRDDTPQDTSDCAAPVRVWLDTVEDEETGVAKEMDEVAVKEEVDVGLRDVRDFNDRVKSIWESRHTGRELLQVLDEIQDVLETSDSSGSAPAATGKQTQSPHLSNSSVSPGLDEVSAARIERLRLELEEKLGEEKLLQVYRVLMTAFQAEEDDGSAKARQHALEDILGDDEMRFVRQVNKLILMEDKFNSAQ